MTHWIKAPLLLVVTNLAHNCEVFCRASACPWFSTSLAEKHLNPKGKGCFTPHHPCRWAEGKAIGGGSTQARGSAQRLTRLLREGKEKSTSSLIHQLGPQGCLQPQKSLLCPHSLSPGSDTVTTAPKPFGPTDKGITLRQSLRHPCHGAQLLFSRQTLPFPHHTRISPAVISPTNVIKATHFSHIL